MKKEILSLKDRLKRRELTIGSWLSFGFAPVCEMMCDVNFDWLVIDMEHTAIDISCAFNLIQIIELSGIVPLVRVGANDPLLIKQVLDAGAHGVIIPMVNTVEDAQRAVNASLYPPYGNRGVGLSRAQGYGASFDDYKKWAEKETIVIVQIEHYIGVDNLEAIMNIDGVDGFIIGPYDLSGSLGKPGQFNHPDVIRYLEKAQKLMNDCSMLGGYHIVHSDKRQLESKIGQGFHFIAYGDDMVLLSEKINEEMKNVQIFKDSFF